MKNIGSKFGLLSLVLLVTACEEDKPSKYTVGPCRSSFWEIWEGKNQLTGASNQAIADGYNINGSWFKDEGGKTIRLDINEAGTYTFSSSSDLNVTPGGTFKFSDTGKDYTALDGIVFSDSAGYDQTCEGSGNYEFCLGDTLIGGSQYDGHYQIYVNFFSESDNCSARKTLLEGAEKMWIKKL
jgi:hypothetical protein